MNKLLISLIFGLCSGICIIFTSCNNKLNPNGIKTIENTGNRVAVKGFNDSIFITMELDSAKIEMSLKTTIFLLKSKYKKIINKGTSDNNFKKKFKCTINFLSSKKSNIYLKYSL